MTVQIDPDYIGSYTAPDGTRFSVVATRGVQEHGWITGNPLDATERGPLTLTINTESRFGGGASVVVDLAADDHTALRNLLDAGAQVANSRNRADDQRPPVGA